MKRSLKNKKDLWVQRKSNFFLSSFTRALKYAIFLSAVKPTCMLHQKAEVSNIPLKSSFPFVHFNLSHHKVVSALFNSHRHTEI